MSALNDLRKKRLALFFTLNISLRDWEQMGHLNREIRIYKHLASHLGEVYFLTYGSGDGDYADRLTPIKVLPKPNGIPAKLYSLVMPFIYWKVLRKVDLLKTNQMPGAWTAVICKFIFRKKLIIRCGYEWELFAKREAKSRLKLWLIHLIEWICYRFADAVILASEEMKRYVCDTFKIPPEKITVIPNYIDTDLFRPLDIEKVPGRLIFVGRLTEQKNLFYLLRAVEGLNVQLVLVGDGPLREPLKEYATKHKINVIFTGRIPNDQLPELLNTAEIFVLPSLYEGNPKALLEAMACSLPVIVTPVEGNREVVSHGINGYLTSDTSSEAIKEVIMSLLSNKDLRERLGRQARKFIEEGYSLKVLIERELALLKSLCWEARSASVILR